MRLSEASQTLLERYLLAVERKLPFQGRKDIISEIRANFMDTMEDRYSPEEVLDAAKLEEEIRRLGSPKAVAAGYRQSDSLIGTQYNGALRLVVIYLTPIVVGAVILAGIISFILSSGKSPFWSLWGLLGNAWSTAVGVIGTFTLLFILLTYFFPKFNKVKDLEILDEEQKDWKISDLPEAVKEPDRYHLWEPIVGIFFGIVGLLFFNVFFNDIAGIWWLSGNTWLMVPIFTAAFIAFIPWISINIGLDMARNGLLLFQHKQTILTRVFEIVVQTSEIILTASMLKAGKLVEFDANLALQRGFPVDGIQGIQSLFKYDVVHWFLIFLLVVLSIELIKMFVNLIKSISQQNQ